MFTLLHCSYVDLTDMIGFLSHSGVLYFVVTYHICSLNVFLFILAILFGLLVALFPLCPPCFLSVLHTQRVLFS